MNALARKEVIGLTYGVLDTPKAPRAFLSAQVEDYSACVEELKRIYPLHWEELALNKDRVPLNPDYRRYEALNDAGMLLFVTLRRAGRLVGYFIGFVERELHYQDSLSLKMDIYFTHPEIRGGTAALRLFRAVIREARRRGVTRTYFGSKLHRDSGRLFAALGMKPVETWYSAMLEDI